jgi:hypothetical protein
MLLKEWLGARGTRNIIQWDNLPAINIKQADTEHIVENIVPVNRGRDLGDIMTVLFGWLMFSGVCVWLAWWGFSDLRAVKNRRASIVRIARQAEKLGEYDKFVE